MYKKMGPIPAMVYVSGFLSDVYTMIEQESDRQLILGHLRDGREMLNLLTRDWAKEKGYRIEGNVIHQPPGEPPAEGLR